MDANSGSLTPSSPRVDAPTLFFQIHQTLVRNLVAEKHIT